MDFHLARVNVQPSTRGVGYYTPFIYSAITLLQLASPVPRPVDPSDFALNQFYSDETEVNRLVRLSLFYALARISARRPLLVP